MKRIGLISDTHGFLDETVFEHFKDCDEIWHAGDFGSVEILGKLEKFKPTRAVFGNIDSQEIQWRCPENLVFEIEGLKVFMTHIGAIPPKYNTQIKKQLDEIKPTLFVCGHSHILRILPDKERKLLYMNSGAAGHEGFHKMRTLLRFEIENAQLKHLEVIELGMRGK